MKQTTSTLEKESSRQCAICFNSDKETKIILKNLLISMQKTKKNKNQEVRNISQQLYLKKYEGSLSKLLKFLFHQKIFDLAQQCYHQSIYNYFVEKSEYSPRELDIISQNIYQTHIKRTFELQILNSQIKCFSKTIIQSIGSTIEKQDEQPEISKNKIFRKEKISIENQKHELESHQNQINTFYYPLIYTPYSQNLIINYGTPSYGI